MGCVPFELCPAGQCPSETELLFLYFLTLCRGAAFTHVFLSQYVVSTWHAVGVQLMRFLFGE